MQELSFFVYKQGTVLNFLYFENMWRFNIC